MTQSTTPLNPWTVVIPFKGSSAAKSRLSIAHSPYPAIGAAQRLLLARAFVHDTVRATLAADGVGRVIVVSSDRVTQSDLSDVTFIADPGEGLNAAITAGIAEAAQRTPQAPIAVLTGDLPGLCSEDLSAALTLAAQFPRAVVADHLGTGTTMITGLPGISLVPHFGGPSHKQHQLAGHHSLDIPMTSTLRQDVDTPRDLNRVAQRGVGVETAAVLAAPTPHLEQRTASPLERTP